MTKTRNRIVAAWILPVAVIGSTAVADDRPGKPNIILCMADDQGWGDVGYAGHAVLKTPNLDAMAAAGLRFDRFYAAAPVCSPTRGSVMTGRHPNRFACFTWGHPLRPQEITIAQSLKTAGYVTGHFGKWHLGAVQKTSPVHPGKCGFDRWLSSPNFFDNDPILSREGVAVQLKGESSIVTMDAAIEFIRDRAGRPEPFLAVVWFGSPHLPYEAADEDSSLYENQEARLRHYYGEITGIDRAMGRLRKELRALGIHENTLVWYCSDNGGVKGVSVTGGRGNKGQIYEGGLRVPAVIEWPAHIPKPTRTEVPTSTVDIYPTLLEIVGSRPPTQRPLDGVSLVPLIDGRMKARSKPLGFWHYPTPGNRTPSKQLMSDLLAAQAKGDEVGDRTWLFADAADIKQQYPIDRLEGHAAWTDWPWKLHRIEAKDGSVEIELYDLAVDPQESKDQSAGQPDRVKSMRGDLERWLASVTTSLNGKDY